MPLKTGGTSITAVLLLILSATSAIAQTQYPDIDISGRLQAQGYFLENEDYAGAVGPRSNVFLRRVRVEARGQISERVSFFIQPSYEGGRALSSLTTTCTSTPVPPGGTPTIVCRTTGRSGFRLRDAYIDVQLTRKSEVGGLYFRAGQEKRPVSRYELLSSNNLPSIERGGGQGVLPRASNDIFTAAGFLSHDVGASVRYEYQLPGKRLLTLKVGIYNGQGESLNDVNGRKSFGARGTFALTPKLDLGASWFAHDGIVTAGTVVDSTFTNYAFDFDAQWGKPGDEGLFGLAEYLHGTDATAAKHSMEGVQAVFAYHFRTPGASWPYAVEPAFRIDLADPARELENDRVTTLTAVIGLYMSSRSQFRIGYERQSFEGGSSPAISGIRSALTVNF